jgi:hypothetical protein
MSLYMQKFMIFVFYALDDNIINYQLDYCFVLTWLNSIVINWFKVVKFSVEMYLTNI